MNAGRPILALIASLGLLACGGPPERVFTDIEPFTAEHEPLFENGVDMVRDPEALGGSWLGTWEEELDRRIRLADVVALVTVRTLRDDIGASARDYGEVPTLEEADRARRRTFRLIAHPDRVYLGEEQVAGQDLVLSVREGEGGFGTVANNERRLLDEQFIAFIKWDRDEVTGDYRARWHLSPATEAVATRVRSLLERRRDVQAEEDGTRRRVIIHRD